MPVVCYLVADLLSRVSCCRNQTDQNVSAIRFQQRGITRYLVFATVSLSLLMTGVAGTSIAVALEAIRAFFGTSVILVGWVIAIFQLGLTASMPVIGKISDVLGRRLTFMACVGLYTIGSAMAALSPNIGLLIAARFLQALGGGGFLPSAVGIVAEEFPQSRQRAVGFFSSIFPIGQIVGPVIGGWLIHSFGWSSVFWVNVPLGLLVLVLAWVLLPAGTPRKGHIDLKGAGLLSSSLASLMGGLSLIAYAETIELRVLVGVLLGASLFLLLSFLRHEATATEPIMELDILRRRPFVAANIYNVIFGAGIIGVISLVPLFAVNAYGMTYLESGLIMVPRGVAMMVTSFLVSILMMRLGYRWPILVGTCLAALSLVALSLRPDQLAMLGSGLDSIAMLSLILLVMGVGVGMAAPASNNACIELMPERVATITGVRGMFRQAGSAVSVTVATLTLHQSTTITAGFQLVFIALAVALFASIPAILIMPKSPKTVASRGDAGSA